jgi:hypothetical protein
MNESMTQSKYWKVFAKFSLMIIALALYPFWLNPLGQWLNRRLFLTADSVIFLAVTLFFSSLFFIFPKLQKMGALFFIILQNKLFQSRIVVIPVITAVFALLVFINQSILHRFLNSADEHSCYFLAETLRMGKWWVTPHELSEFFNVVHVGNKAGKWFSVYPPGWPAIWAIGLNFHIQDYLNPIMSVFVLGIFFSISKKMYGHGVAVASVFFTGLTAFFLFTGASYYSHTTCLLAMMIFLFAYLKWSEATDETNRLKWTLVIGLAVGYGLLTRYLTMAAFCAPFLIFRVIPLVTRKRSLRKSDVLFFVLIGLAFAFIFWQNYSVTGELHKAPNRFDKSWERLGFRADYTIVDGLFFFITRFFYLSEWVSPFMVFAFIFFSFHGKYKSIDDRLIQYSFYFPAIAYFFYYSWGGNQYGPRYLYEGWPFMVLTVMVQIKRLHEMDKIVWRNFFLFGLLLSVFVSGYQITTQSKYYKIVSRERNALYALAKKDIHQKAIVFIKGFLGDTLVIGEEDAVRNSPQLDAEILYAHDRGDENPKLMQYYPEHQYFRGFYDHNKKAAVLEPLFKRT